MNRQERAVARAHKAVRRLAALDVVYVDGETEIPLKATKTESNVEVIESDGSAVIARSSDWRVHAEKLVAGEERIRPRPGAEIHATVAGRACVYEVMPVGGDSCYEEADPYGRVFRIHSKLKRESTTTTTTTTTTAAP